MGAALRPVASRDFPPGRGRPSGSRCAFTLSLWIAARSLTPTRARIAQTSPKALAGPRDGNFADKDEPRLLAAYHNDGFYPDNRFCSFGFRCARSP